MLKLLKKHKLTIVALTVGIAMTVLFGACAAQSDFASSPEPAASPSAESPSTAISIVDKVVKSLEWGNVVFNLPTEIQFEEPEIVQLLLSPSKTVEELQAELNQQGELESAQVQVSNRMQATLYGQSFNVKSLVPEVQLVSSERTTEWRWEVTPTEYGEQSLHLALLAIVNISGQKEPYVIRTYNKTIEVKISPSQHVSKFITKNWQWLWAAVLVPVVTFFWKWYQNKISQKTT